MSGPGCIVCIARDLDRTQPRPVEELLVSMLAFIARTKLTMCPPHRAALQQRLDARWEAAS